MQVKESFFSLLESSESLKDAVRIDPHHKANFTIATDLLSSDPLWKSVEQPRALFEEWVEEKMAEEMERKKLDNRKRRERFARFLKTVEWINVKTSWREAEQRLMGVYEFEELQDDLVGRLEVWQDHMAEVEERDRKDREVRVMEQRRQERMNREAFKSQVLMPHRERGVLHHKMRWREYHAMISGEPALRAVEDNLKGSRPKELFMDVIEELEQEAEEAMVIVDQKLGDLPEERVFEIMDASVSLSCDDFWELLVRHIQEGCRSNSDLKSKLKLEQSSITMRQGVWFECKSRVMRERHRRVERFKDLLRRRMLSNELTLSTTFEEATELCGNDPEWKDVAADDEERKRLFEASLADLKAAEEKKERELVAAEREISKKRRRRRGKHDTYADRDREYNSYSDFSDRSSEDATARREGRGHRRRGYDRKRYRHRRSRSRSLDRGRNRRDGEKRRDRDPHESDREVEEGEVR